MPSSDKTFPTVVSRKEWHAARQEMKKTEENFARKEQAIIAQWHNMPMVEIDAGHKFAGPNGEVTLVDLFESRRQLLVYHFWFQPGHEPCPGCSQWTYDLGNLGGEFATLGEADTSLAFVSRATPSEIEEVKRCRSWTMPWFSIIGDEFDDMTGYDEWAQISVFIRDGGKAYLANVVPFDDLKTIGNHWTLLDRTPCGTSASR